MVGRAALGQPWLFRAMRQGLDNDLEITYPGQQEIQALILEHIQELHAFYGDHQGIRIARKHSGWYMDHLSCTMNYKPGFNALTNARSQLDFVGAVFDQMTQASLT